MGNGKSISYERQLVNTYKEGFKKLLIQQDVHYKVRDAYLKLFDKVITTKTIATTYRNLKITQVKVILDNYASEHGINIKIN